MDISILLKVSSLSTSYASSHQTKFRTPCFTVMEVQNQRIMRVVVKKLEKPAEETDEA